MTTPSYVQPYEPPSGVGRFTNTRLGNSNDVLVLYDGDADEVSAYFQGFLLWGYLFLALFSLWSMALCVCMCMGRKRVGFASGRPFRMRNDSRVMEGTDRVDEDFPQQSSTPSSHQVDRNETRRCSIVEPICTLPNIVRVCFIVMACLIIILAPLFATKGLQSLQDSVETYHSNTLQLQSLTKQGRQLMDQGSNAVTATGDLLSQTLARETDPSQFCPSDPNIANSQPALDAFAQVEAAKNAIDYLQDYDQDEVQEINDALDEFQDDLREAEEEIDQVQLYNAGAKIILAFYILLSVAFIAATVLAIFGKEFAVLTKGLQWLGVPIFVLITATNLVWIVVLPIMGGVNSDFCEPYGQGSSPDDLVFEVLRREGYGFGNERYEAAQYFIQYQCQNSPADINPYRRIDTYLRDLDIHQAGLADLLRGVRDGNEVARYCGRDFSVLIEELEEMDVLINLLRSTALEFLDVVSCSNLVPIYTSSVYDASCANSTKSIFWLYITAFFLAFIGYLMITFRAAYRVSCADSVGHVEGELKMVESISPPLPYTEYLPQAEELPSGSQHMPVQHHMCNSLASPDSVYPLPVPQSPYGFDGPKMTKSSEEDGFDC